MELRSREPPLSVNNNLSTAMGILNLAEKKRVATWARRLGSLGAKFSLGGGSVDLGWGGDSLKLLIGMGESICTLSQS